MFQKKDYIYSETMGVCLVADVTNLAPKKGNAVSYYVLKSVYQKDKVAYIPVEKHAVELRELISLEEAKRLAEECQLFEKLGAQNEEETEQIMEIDIPEGMSQEQFLLRKGEVEFVIKRDELMNSQKKDKKKKAAEA